MKVFVVAAALAGLTLAGDPPSDPPSDPIARSTMAQDSLGKVIFTGKGICATCHGPEAKGTALGPNLTDSTWLHADGSLESITKVIREGVATPKEHPAPMPAMGGAQLSADELAAVSRYVYSLTAGG